MRKEVRCFTLPAEENLLNTLLNDDMIEVVDEERMLCPKEGTILYLVKIERYGEE